MFCYPESIDREMARLFSSLTAQKHFKSTTANDFAVRAAHFLAELNAIHPFREGNGRTQLTFLILLAETADHPLDIEHLGSEAVMRAMIESFDGDEKLLVKLILSLVRR